MPNQAPQQHNKCKRLRKPVPGVMMTLRQTRHINGSLVHHHRGGKTHPPEGRVATQKPEFKKAWTQKRRRKKGT